MIPEFLAVWGPAVAISLGTFFAARVVRPASPAWPPARARRVAGRSWRPALRRGRGRYRTNRHRVTTGETR